MDYDQELISDFIGEYSDAQHEIEIVLGMWNPYDDNDSINTLFRAIHSIKSNLCMMELMHLSEVIHKLEDLLSQIREKKRTIIPGFTILISITLEQCKELAKQTLSGIEKSTEISQISNIFANLCQSNNSDFTEQLFLGIKSIDNIGAYGNEYSSEAVIDFVQQEEEKRTLIIQSNDHTLLNGTSQTRAEIDFFIQLMTQVESYFPFWKNRSERILTLVNKMNQHFNTPIDQDQLLVGVYLHDIGMSFIPPQKIYISKQLQNEDRQLMHTHCELGFKWLSLIKGWESAATMILQHHEHFDGKGYPSGLKSDQICMGAKFLAIGDTYASITGQDKKGQQSKPIMHAVTEINQGAGQQFDPECVDAFNQVIRSLNLKQ